MFPFWKTPINAIDREQRLIEIKLLLDQTTADDFNTGHEDGKEISLLG